MKSDLETAVKTAKGNVIETADAQSRVSEQVANVLNEHFGVNLSRMEASAVTQTFLSVLALRSDKEPTERPTREAVTPSPQPRTPLVASKRKRKRHEKIAAEENKQKPRSSPRQRTHEPFPLMELDSYDVLSMVLTHLPFEDLNSLAVCNKRLRELRSHDSLDQTRSLTLDFSNGSGNALERLAAKIYAIGPNRFQGNNVGVYLKGFVQNLDDDWSNINNRHWRPPSLPGVTCLCLKEQSNPENPFVKWENSFDLVHRFFPNLRHLDIGYNSCFENFHFRMIDRLNRNLGGLKTLSCTRSHVNVIYDGALRTWDSLRELYLDGVSDSSFPKGKGVLKHSLPPNLERLDIRGVRMRLSLTRTWVPEDAIVDLVQNRPALRWLRCDLSDDTRLALVTKRPDLMIVNW